MAPVSDFERQRQENIKRNRDLLRQLELDSLTDSISRDARASLEASQASSKKRKPNGRKKGSVKKEVVAPARRSRRLQGIELGQGNSAEYQQQLEQEEEARKQREKLDELRRTRLFGKFKLIDLVTDKRSGRLKNEDKVIGRDDDDVLEIKKENDVLEVKDEMNEDIDPDHAVLRLLRELGDKYSAGDFYELIKQQPIEYDEKVLTQKRDEFENLKVSGNFDPNDVKVTHERITSINFHPSKSDRIVAAGDKVGHLGLWAVDSKTNSSAEDDDENQPAITVLRPHGKTVARILSKSTTQLLSASYDGSVRLLDLNKLDSSEVINVTSPFDAEAGDIAVSDINLCVEENPSLLYLTTLGGNFYQHDIRTRFDEIKAKSFLRLHDKKIGSFSINPNAPHQIATASLDRSLKVWDLRNVSRANAQWSEYDLGEYSPHAYGSFNSRLSISGVDWNADNRLVCNGYDDKIRIFDFSGGEDSGNAAPVITEWSDKFQPPAVKGEEQDTTPLIPVNLNPFTTIKHNCQTGRWVTILKSKWQVAPADGVQKFAIGNMNRGIDVYDQRGQILAHLSDPEKLGAVPAVVGFHPTENWVIGGSASGKVYLFE